MQQNPRKGANPLYNTEVNKGDPTMRYQVKCSSAPYENTSTDSLDRAYDLCYNLSEEYGYVEIVEWVGPYQQLVADYTWGK